ncbi:MAG: hypothetical protein ACYTGV_15805, partial [Planctomycetota bacterium]
MAASRIGARDALIVATLLAAGAAYLVPLRSHGLILCDDGYYLLPATRMLAGDVLYRDILVHYPPLRYHLLAAVFSLVEPSVLAARGVWIALLLAAAALTTRVSARLVPGWLAWVPAGILLLVPGPWHKAPYALSSALFFLVLARALERPGRLRFAVAGAVAGMAVCTRQDIGFAFVGLGAAAAVLPTLLPSSLAAEQLQRRRREGLGDLAS